MGRPAEHRKLPGRKRRSRIGTAITSLTRGPSRSIRLNECSSTSTATRRYMPSLPTSSSLGSKSARLVRVQGPGATRFVSSSLSSSKSLVSYRPLGAGSVQTSSCSHERVAPFNLFFLILPFNFDSVFHYTNKHASRSH